MKKRLHAGLSLFLATVFCLAASLAYTSQSVDQSIPTQARAPLQKQDTKSILILGVDGRPRDLGRSDTLMLLTIDGTKKVISGVSIPRDSLVEVPGHGYTKINGAYGYGGPQLTAKAIEALLGVEIDAYVAVNFDEFRTLIDRFGGVEITVDQDMHYVDRAGGLYIDLKKGIQVLDGKAALDFVRFRHDKLNDFGRMTRQQELVRALVDKLASPKMALAALGTLEQTNLRPGGLVSLWPAVRDRDSYKFEFSTARGASVRTNSGWYYVLEANRAAAEAELGLKANRTAPEVTVVPVLAIDAPQKDFTDELSAPQPPGAAPLEEASSMTPEPLPDPSSSAPESPTGGLGAQ